MITPITVKIASLVGFFVSLFFPVCLDVAAAFSQAPSTASCCHHNFSYPLRSSLETGPSSRSRFSSVIQIAALRHGSQSLCRLDASAVKMSVPSPTSSHLKLLLGPSARTTAVLPHTAGHQRTVHRSEQVWSQAISPPTPRLGEVGTHVW